MEMCILQTRTYAKGGPMELKFEGIEMRKLIRKLGHLSGYYVYSQNYGHKNIKSGSSSFVFSVDDSKVSLTV